MCVARAIGFEILFRSFSRLSLLASAVLLMGCVLLLLFACVITSSTSASAGDVELWTMLFLGEVC
jgi:hypothetical protein